jgi:pyruvate,orthophosphate dikinase
MSGLPVTIRLLDPPLHEFVPHDEAGQAAMARDEGLAGQDPHARRGPA